MGLTDLFKSKAEFALLNVDSKLAENIKELKLGEIIEKSGDRSIVIIKNPNTINIYQLKSEDLEHLPSSFFVGRVPVIREDIAAEEAIIINNLRAVLSGIRQYMSGEDYGTLSYAAYIVKIEDSGMDATEQIAKLFDAYGPRGMRIYSLLRSGSFEKEILPLIKQGGDKGEMFKLINKSIEQPEPVFVSKFMTKGMLRHEIEKRFKIGIKSFNIFARAKRVGLAREVVIVLLKEKKIVCKIEEYSLGKDRAATFQIQKLG
jgi:hypothetical protein